MKELNAYDAEFRSKPSSRGRSHREQYEEVVIVAEDFFHAAELALRYGIAHWPKLVMVGLELRNNKVQVQRG
jgi:hypothetical protein